MVKVEKIIDPEFRKGVSAKTGQAWVLVKVKLSDGHEATGFGPVTEGDEVDVKYNDEYSNWSFAIKKLSLQDLANILERIEKKLDKLGDSGAKEESLDDLGLDLPDEV